MKAFNKNIILTMGLFTLLISFLLSSMHIYAAEVPQVESEKFVDEISLIYGLKAVIRKCNNLNIREQPSKSSNILGTIPKDTEFTIIDQEGEWFKIEYQEISGYVYWKNFKFIETEISENPNLLGNSIIHYKSSPNRDNNMNIASSKINGIILQPGEKFIWSEIIGQTYEKDGYLPAPVIMNRKSASGIGGGVCQVSTTMYNALLDMDSIEFLALYEHSITSAYAEKNATVAHGSKDFIFKNNYDFPIRIETYSYKGVVLVDIYRHYSVE